jgi:putative sigma-54 modulation protein
MQKKITARHFDLTPEIRERADEEMDGLNRYFDNIISAEFILDVERHRRLAELKVKVSRDILAAEGESDEMYKSMSLAVDKMKIQLKRHKEKLKEREPEQITKTQEALTRPSTDDEALDV